jgi:signal transduction histidine kinase
MFGACVAAVAAALGWVTFVSLRLERRETDARAEARFQASLRLALWRMDSLLTPIIAQEAARPYAHYAAFYPQDQGFDRASNALRPSGLLVPSPLLGYTSEFIRLHFQVSQDGAITSPEAPEGEQLDLAKAAQTGGPDVSAAQKMLARLRRFATRKQLLEKLAHAAPNGAAAVVVARRSPLLEQAQAAARDFATRQQMANLAQNPNQQVQPPQPAPPPSRRPEVAVEQGPFVPVWLNPPAGDEAELVFLRSVTIGPTHIVQGIWADWPRLRRWLLDGIGDLLPHADLKPVVGGSLQPTGQMLASIPAVLEAAPAAARGTATRPAWTPMRAILLATWLAALAAVTAVGFVLRAAIALGERRLQFASAVTHELRTPLTTFRMYSEMLASDMLPDEKCRREYLATLSREAERLSHVVENVLLYARVEQDRAATRYESVAMTELLERVAPRLSRRAQEAQMELVVDGEPAKDASLSVDCQAVEQILFNLVDNSCKYAGAASDRRLHLDVRVCGARLEMLYRDHGPGIPPSEEKRIFETFSRAARDAQSATPGIGLGLALAKGLARELGGDLKLVRRPDAGAAFLLILPLRR